LRAPATAAVSTLSLHDALPISQVGAEPQPGVPHPGRDDLLQAGERAAQDEQDVGRVDLDEILVGVFAPSLWGDARDRAFQDLQQDRKSTRLNSSHVKISYAVFC